MKNTYYGFNQIANEPTLLSSTSCIDLILTNQPNFVISSGVHPLLHQNFHHQMILGQFNLKVYYPASYKGLIWDYKRANIDAINLGIKSFNSEKAFIGKDINSQVELIFSENFMNRFSNFIPKRVENFIDNDLLWMNDDI